MAERRNANVFDKEEDYEDARSHFHREMHSDYYDNDRLCFMLLEEDFC